MFTFIGLWVVNSKKQVLCQKRSLLKDSNPGKWESFFGGHIRSNQDYLDNALVELREEVGIKATKEDFHLFQVHKCDSDKEFQAVYYIIWDGDLNSLKLEKEEVDQVKWFNIHQLLMLLVDKKVRNWTLWSYQKNLLQKLATKVL